jgi:broad specificity phosphatase PhoE/predicted GNAT family acetyltransferase
VTDLQCPATILVVRHGESEGNLGRRLTSAAPGEPLTERGRGQVAAVAERLRAHKIAQVYASPLLRAQQTGELLAAAFGVGLGTLDGVREVSMGRHEGSEADEDWAQVDATFLRWFDGDLPAGIDGGETGDAVVARMRQALHEVADMHRGETVVVVSHGGAMRLALPRCASDLVDHLAREHPIPNCGVAELSVDGNAWTLLQWPGDPDRAPHPGDLIDLVGRAAEQWLQASADGAAIAADVHGVPCASFDIDAPWATQAALTGRADLPAPHELGAVLDWLETRRPGSWQVRVRAEQRAELASAGLVPALELGVWITDRRPYARPPDGVDIGEAADAAEFVSVFGDDLAPLLTGQIGRPGRAFLILREQGRAVACARVTQTGGTAHVSAITVLPECRGRGLGRLMSAAATSYAVRQAGLAWLHCADSMAPLYEQLGYRRLTTHVDFRPA